MYDVDSLKGTVDRVVGERMAYVERDDVRRSHEASFDMAPPRRFFTPEELATVELPVLCVLAATTGSSRSRRAGTSPKHRPPPTTTSSAAVRALTQIEHPEAFERLLVGLVDRHR